MTYKRTPVIARSPSSVKKCDGLTDDEAISSLGI